MCTSSKSKTLIGVPSLEKYYSVCCCYLKNEKYRNRCKLVLKSLNKNSDLVRQKICKYKESSLIKCMAILLTFKIKYNFVVVA